MLHSESAILLKAGLCTTMKLSCIIATLSLLSWGGMFERRPRVTCSTVRVQSFWRPDYAPRWDCLVVLPPCPSLAEVGCLNVSPELRAPQWECNPFALCLWTIDPTTWPATLHCDNTGSTSVPLIHTQPRLCNELSHIRGIFRIAPRYWNKTSTLPANVLAKPHHIPNIEIHWQEVNKAD